MGDQESLSGAHDALDRMKRAFDRGTGCRLTFEMLSALSVSIIGQMWNEDRPEISHDQ